MVSLVVLVSIVLVNGVISALIPLIPMRVVAVGVVSHMTEVLMLNIPGIMTPL